MRRALVVALVCWASFACGAPQPLPGMDQLRSAEFELGQQSYARAQEHAEAALEDDVVKELSPAEQAEAHWVAGEAAFAQGRHLKAFRHYKSLLETAHASPRLVAVEDRLFELGEIYLFDDEYGGWFDSRARGVEVLETLQIHYAQSDQADDALRRIGEYFASDDVQNWREAALTYEQLFREYPTSEWAERSLWLAGHYRLRLVPGPRYNQAELLRAQELLRLSLREHPRGVAVHDARADLAAAREMMAESEVMIADFYAARDRDFGEQLKLANAALLYPDTRAGQQALERLAALGLDLQALGVARFNSLDKAVAPRSAWDQ
ncbi:MAG: hypothetical protein DHS20C15_14820 [Planctomycetota bacterium]|nr:MAG: hypothetical protein DHS20C15_14820 [Planctomycetota bacterium]